MACLCQKKKIVWVSVCVCKRESASHKAPPFHPPESCAREIWGETALPACASGWFVYVNMHHVCTCVHCSNWKLAKNTVSDSIPPPLLIIYFKLLNNVQIIKRVLDRMLQDTLIFGFVLLNMSQDIRPGCYWWIRNYDIYYWVHMLWQVASYQGGKKGGLQAKAGLLPRLIS